MIAVESKVTIYEKDGADTKGPNLPIVTVHSHWNRREFVVLDLGDLGRACVTVSAADLRAAIDNATRTAK